MVPIETVFIGLVFMFALIGALRGWAKELLVTFSVALARFVELVLQDYIPFISVKTLVDNEPKTWLFVRLALFVVFVSFGYATTAISAKLGGKARREKFQDALLGLFLGAINGYLVVGMIWGFLDKYGYKKLWGITGPTKEAVLNFIPYLPTNWLGGPILFISVAVAFAFVLIVFV